MVQVITHDNEEYEVIPPQSVAASKMLVDAYEKLGKPDDPFSKSGEKVMDIIVAIWEDLYPEQVKEWEQGKKDYKSIEMNPKEQARQQTGRSLASVPMPIYRLIKKVFPNYKLSTRDSWMKFIKRYPRFKMTEDNIR